MTFFDEREVDSTLSDVLVRRGGSHTHEGGAEVSRARNRPVDAGRSGSEDEDGEAVRGPLQAAKEQADAPGVQNREARLEQAGSRYSAPV